MKKGFTLTEILIVIGLISLLIVVTIPVGMGFYREQLLESSTEILSVNLKKAQARALQEKGDSSWGVRIEDNEYILFKGNDYDNRDNDWDEKVELSGSQVITTIFGENQEFNEIIFEKGTGKPSFFYRN